MIVKNDLYDYKDRYIYQDKRLFRFSIDSILLAEFSLPIADKYKVLDLCTGNAPVPLILSKYTTASIDAIEIQEDIFNLATLSIKENNLAKQINIYLGNANDISKIVPNKKYDVITCNPPYFKVEKHGFINTSEQKAIARHEIMINIEDIFKLSHSVLKDKGVLYLIHRANRLNELINLGEKYNIRVKLIQLIKTSCNNLPEIVLIKCVNNSKNNVIINDIIDISKVTTYQHMFWEE